MHRCAAISHPARLSRLRRTGLLDSGPEPAYDRLTQLAARVLHAKVGLISLVDGERRYFKSCTGIGGDHSHCRETPLTHSFCQLVVEQAGVLAIADAHLDARVQKDPVIQEFGIAAYLGVPLATADEHVLGTLCVMDPEPRVWSEDDIALLRDLAAAVMSEIQLREEVQGHERSQRRLRLHLEVTEVLASELTLMEGIDRILSVIAQELGFTAGVLWRASDADERLRCVGFWRAAGAPLEDFERVTRQLSFARGEALVGRVWAEGRPSWVTNLQTDKNFAGRKMAMEGGLHSSFAFPVCSPEAAGVMCFFGPESWQPDATLQLSLAGLGQQIGAFVQHRWIAAAAEERRKFLDAVVENLSEGIMAWDASGELILCNAATNHLQGLREDVVSNLWNEPERLFMPDGETPLTPEQLPIAQALRGEPVRQLDMIVRGHDGRNRAVLASSQPVRDRCGEAIGTVMVLHDVSTFRQASEDLVKSEHRFRQLCDLAPVGIFQTDVDGGCTFVNEQWRRYTGLTTEQGLGDGWAAGLHPDFAHVYNRWRKVAPSGVEFSTEFRFQSTDGQTAWVYGQTVPLRSNDGRVTGHIGVLRDISVYKQAEEAMRQRKTAAEQANEAKSRFLANMSHEVRTPLNGILGLSRMLLDGDMEDAQRKIADLVLGSAESLLVIVNDILDFSKVESGHLELEQIEYDPRDVIRSVVQLNETRATEKGLVLEIRLSPDLPARLCGDPARLQQVLNNLVSNATKFSNHGRVRIEVEPHGVLPAPRLLRFSVTDEGAGIPPEAKERIFDPFAQADASTTRRFGGTGLGLSICKHLVELMGGTIDVQSEPGQGSTFSFTIPQNNSPAVLTTKELALGSPADPCAPPEPPLALRVLLAEDNKINRLVAVNQLEKLGCMVDSVEDGQAAVEAALEKTYDLIFMDCHMPVLDGYGATRDIRRRWTRQEPVRIIALTANAMQGERERCLDCGMDEYLSKPFDAAGLRRAMAAVLPAETIKRASHPPEPATRDRSAVLDALSGMEADGVDVQLVVDLFREEAAQALDRVEEALASGNAGELWRAAHKLKGTAAELGAEALRDHWGKLEQCGRTGDLRESARLFQFARLELEQVRKVIDSAPINPVPVAFN